MKPFRVCGSRCVSHEVAAMKRVLSKYGAYLAHIESLAQDRSVSAAQRAKLTGYRKKWCDAKLLLGCAFFVDFLRPCTTFSKYLQADDINILEAVTGFFKTLKELANLSEKPVEELPTFKSTISK